MQHILYVNCLACSDKLIKMLAMGHLFITNPFLFIRQLFVSITAVTSNYRPFIGYRSKPIKLVT